MSPGLAAQTPIILSIELKDDNYQVPRSKSLIARRLPPANKARGGSAGKYIAGTSAALGGRDDTLDRRVEAGSRAELLAKRGISMPGLPPGKHLTARFDGKSDPKVSRGVDCEANQNADTAAFSRRDPLHQRMPHHQYQQVLRRKTPVWQPCYSSKMPNG